MSSTAATQSCFSSPYDEFLAELSEIQRHKWHLSEQAGSDIGFERALNDWARHHRADWRRVRNQPNCSSPS
ncbi:MAG: hypothetical protein IPK32_12770 [Verrucomicrobiaceae bacterium]|nr:hypothetical protein [Verrucomicrobiaceae bacterium]